MDRPYFIGLFESRLGVQKKVSFAKFFIGIFEILEYPFLFEHFRNVPVVQFGSRL